MTTAFLSYSRKDKIFAQRLAARLEQSKFEVWVDWEDIPYSVEWWNEIREGIDTSENFICIITSDSLSSRICNQEIEHARRGGKRIIPVIRRQPDEQILSERWSRKELTAVGQANWSHIQELNFLFIRKKNDPQFDCHYDDVTEAITNPDCDGPESDAEDFETMFQGLVKAVQEDNEHNKYFTQLHLQATQWQQKPDDYSRLLGGARLREAEIWLITSTQKSPVATDLQKQYLAASRMRENIVARRRLGLAIGVAISSLILAMLAGVGFTQANIALATSEARGTQVSLERDQAQNLVWAANAQQAMESGDALLALPLAIVANAQQAQQSGNPFLALPLAIEAGSMDRPPLIVQRALADIGYNAGVRQLFAGHQGAVKSVAFLPDGTTGLSASTDGNIILWDFKTGAELRRFVGHSAQVRAIDMSADGSIFLSAADDKTIRIWDTRTGTELKRLEGHDGFVIDAEFGPDDQTILSGSQDATIIMWDVETGEIKHRLDASPTRTWVSSVALNADGNLALSGDLDGALILWDMLSGTQIRTFDNSAPIASIAFSTKTRTFLTGLGDKIIALWDMRTGEVIRRFAGHTASLSVVKWSPNERYILSGAADRIAILWDAETGAEIRRFEGHTSSVLDVAFSPDTRQIITGSEDTRMLLWDVYNGAEIERYDDFEHPIFGVTFSPDGLYAVNTLQDDDYPLVYWEIASKQVRYRVHDEDAWYLDAAFNPTGDRLLVGASSGEVLLLDSGTGDEIWRNKGHQDWVRSVAFSPQGDKAVTGSYDRTLLIWDTNTGSILSTLTGHTDFVTSAIFSADGTQIISGSADQTVRIWDVASASEIAQLEGYEGISVSGLALSPVNDTQLLTSSFDGTLVLWDLTERRPIRQFFGHTGGVTDVDFSPDGNLAASSSLDNTVILWDVASGTELRRFVGHSAWVTAIDFGHDGKTILSGSYDRTMIRWRIDTVEELIAWIRANRYIRDLTCNEQINFAIEFSCIAVTPSLR